MPTALSPLLASVLGTQEDLPGLDDVHDQYYDAVAHFLLRYAAAAEKLPHALSSSLHAPSTEFIDMLEGLPCPAI